MAKDERNGNVITRWIADFFDVGFTKVWDKFADYFARAVGKSMSSFEQNFKGGELDNEEILAFWDDLERIGAIDKNDREYMQNWINSFKGMGRPFMYWTLNLAILMNMMTRHADIAMGTYNQKLMSEHTPNPPGVGDIMRALFVAPEKAPEIIERMKANGFDEKDIDLMILSNYAVYPAEVVRDAWLRGILDDDMMFTRMRELGFTDTRTKEMVQTWNVIPSPSDLFWMVGKEAFEEDIIRHIGLDDEFPAGQLEWLQKQGISEFWAKKYWYAHWDTPSVGQAYEMLHRGVISEEEMDIAFRNAEVPPFWRQKLKEIAYNVYTRVDTRRMHAMGVLSDEELIKAYMDQGYNRERAEKMTEFTMAYNARSEKDISMSQIMRAYRTRSISEDQAISLLKKLKYTETKAQWLLALEDIKIDMDIQDDIIKNLRDRYENNLIAEQDVKSRLNELNLRDREIQVMIDRWNINKYEDMKLHSKTDLGKMYMSKVIDEDEYRSDMRRIGYNFRQTENYLQYMKKEKKPI